MKRMLTNLEGKELSRILNVVNPIGNARIHYLLNPNLGRISASVRPLSFMTTGVGGVGQGASQGIQTCF